LGTLIDGTAAQSEFFGWLSMEGEGGREFGGVASISAVRWDSPYAGSGGGELEVPRGEHGVEVLESPTGKQVSIGGDCMCGSVVIRWWSFSPGWSGSISTSFRQPGVLNSRTVKSNGSIGCMTLSRAI
jgi:hypothetical protein